MKTRSKHDDLLRHSLLLLAATQVANVSNLLFQVLMGRRLPHAEYGVLISMLNLVLIISTPMQAVQSAAAHFASRLQSEGRVGGIRALVLWWCRDLAWFAVPLGLLGIVCSGWLAGFFQLDQRAPIVLTAVILALTLYMPVFAGVLQGMQSFIWMAVSMHSWGVVRLLAGIVLVLGWRAVAAAGLTAQLLGVIVSVGLGILALRLKLGAEKSESERIPGVRSYFFSSVLILAGFAFLMNADMVLIKHYFLPDAAGLYARASVIGRSVVFLPMPVALAMFPKVTSTGATSGASWRTFLRALGYSSLLIGVAVAACTIWPWIPLRIIYNDHAPGADMLHLVRVVVWAMGPLALLFLLMNFELAQHRFRGAAVIPLGAAAYVIGAVFHHRTAVDIFVVLGTVTLFCSLVLIVNLPWRGGRGPSAASGNGGR